jgi:hypothetical protein
MSLASLRAIVMTQTVERLHVHLERHEDDGVFRFRIVRVSDGAEWVSAELYPSVAAT